MTTTKQSWLKRSLAVLLAVMMVMSMGVANVFTAEKTTAEKYTDLHEYASTLKAEDYTEKSWAQFDELWSAIKSVSDISGLSQTVQENFLSRLETAVNNLEKVSEKTTAEKYTDLHEYASTLKAEDYTEESWAQFDELWSAIKSVSDISGLSQTVQENFLSRLETAVNNLEKVSEKTTAEKYAELHEYASTLKAEDYTEESWAQFDELWSAIKSVSDISGLSQETQEDFLSKLEEAIESLEGIEQNNYQKYLALIEQAESLDSSPFTTESWQEFQAALKSEKEENFIKAEQEYEETGDIADSYITNMEDQFLLLYFKEAVTLSDGETGIQVSSYNYDMRNAAELDIVTYDETNWPYTTEGAWHTNIALSSTTYSAFQILIKDGEGNTVDTLRNFEVNVPIPQKFDLDGLNIRLAQKSGASYKPTYKIDEENRMLTVSISNSLAKYSNGMTVFFYNPIDTVDVSTLANGIYRINVDLVKHSDSGVSSMADGTLEATAILVKNDSAIDVYLSFVPINYLGAPAYTGGLWCEVGEKADGKLDESSMTVLSYYCNDDGTLMDNAIYNAVTEVACVKQIKLSLNDDCKNENGGYTLAVSSPAMAAINNLPFEEIIPDELLVNLLISNPEYLGTTEFAQEYIPVYDKSALLKEIEYAKIFSDEEYTADSFNKLADAVAAGENVYATEYQDEISASAAYEKQIKLITDAISNLEESTELTDAKESLQKVIDSAKAIEIGSKTESAYTKLQEAISASENVLNNTTSNISDINAAKKTLENAIVVFNNSENATAISKDNLPDGVYSVYVDMVKMDRVSKSMADNAINHTVKLEVINGEYYITLDFKGITIENRFGYLMDLSYYADGYSYGDYGTVTGSLVPAEVLTTQKDSSGNDVIDQYNDVNNLYPDIVRIKLSSQAIADEDGYVPLHVFVPIMEAIAEGNGDQDVLMKLDWSTLKETTEDDPSFEPEEPVEQSPAVDFTDSATGVKVSADRGVFDEGVQIVVSEITQGADYDVAVVSLSDIGKKFKLYDVKFLDADGNELAPNGTVSISFPIAAGYDFADLAVYRLDDGGKVLVRGTVENGYYTVITKTAGAYALVEKGSTITDAENTENAGNSNTDIPQTGDSSSVAVYALLVLAAAGMMSMTVIIRKRRTAT